MSDRLIDDYLRDLKTAAWIRQLPKAKTAALEQETRERIADAVEAAGNRNEATVAGVLERMGTPAHIVGGLDEPAPTGARQALSRAIAPLARLQFTLSSRGWGAAEVGALVLLIVAPYLIWWIGPIFGIILVRAGSDRWSERAKNVATRTVLGLLAVQAVLAVVLLIYALMNGGSVADELQRVMSTAAGHIGTGQVLVDIGGASGPLLWVRIFGSLLAPIAGLVAGIYLAFSPRAAR